MSPNNKYFLFMLGSTRTLLFMKSLQKSALNQNSVRAGCIFLRWPCLHVYPILYAPLTVWLAFIPQRCESLSLNLGEGYAHLDQWSIIKESCVTPRLGHNKDTDFIWLSLGMLILGSQPPNCEEAQATGRGHVSTAPVRPSADRQHQLTHKNKPSDDSCSQPTNLPAEAPVLWSRDKTVLPLWSVSLIHWNCER